MPDLGAEAVLKHCYFVRKRQELENGVSSNEESIDSLGREDTKIL